jgi:hypothetical protein
LTGRGDSGQLHHWLLRDRSPAAPPSMRPLPTHRLEIVDELAFSDRSPTELGRLLSIQSARASPRRIGRCGPRHSRVLRWGRPPTIRPASMFRPYCASRSSRTQASTGVKGRRGLSRFKRPFQENEIGTDGGDFRTIPVSPFHDLPSTVRSCPDRPIDQDRPAPYRRAYGPLHPSPVALRTMRPATRARLSVRVRRWAGDRSSRRTLPNVPDPPPGVRSEPSSRGGIALGPRSLDPQHRIARALRKPQPEVGMYAVSGHVSWAVSGWDDWQMGRCA